MSPRHVSQDLFWELSAFKTKFRCTPKVNGQSHGLSLSQRKVNNIAKYYRAFYLKVWYLCQLKNDAKVPPLRVVTILIIFGLSQPYLYPSVSQLCHILTLFHNLHSTKQKRPPAEDFRGLCRVSLDGVFLSFKYFCCSGKSESVFLLMEVN